MNAAIAPALIAGVLALTLASPAKAGTISGSAQVIDGDSLVVGRIEVRLYGIDAPEAQQPCMRARTSWRCGEEAARQLGTLVAGKTVSCVSDGIDSYGRSVAVCTAAGLALNRAMVVHGWATAFREYSLDYAADEDRAKAARLGIWDSTFVAPADYRHAPAASRTAVRPKPARADAQSPTGCVIKGNRNRSGQWIYHLPGMPYYDQTRAEEIFCSEAQAQQAGYRRAIVK